MADEPDRYDAWYRAKLWNLLPAIYRAEDAPFGEVGPLEELVARIGAQAAVVRRSIDRLWEDQSIETCDDAWIPYLGELLATNLVASLDARQRRVDVGRTIYYRRRKGTVGLLEELATDVTGWSVRVEEFFRRMGRTRHGLDLVIGGSTRLVGARTGTPMGGLADLRDVHGASLTSSAFDEYSHTADVRRGQGATGWYDIPHVGVFVWRLKSFGVAGATMVQSTTCPNQFTFDPTGRDIQLFALGDHPVGDRWTSPTEAQVPGAISAGLLASAFDALYLDTKPRSLAVAHYVGALPPPTDYADIIAATVTHDPRRPTGVFIIDPVRGRIILPAPPAATTAPPYLADYHYGFASEIGAGAYDRRRPGVLVDDAPLGRTNVNGGTGLATALAGVAAVGAVGTVTINDSRTYTDVANLAGVVDVELRAGQQVRPLVRPTAAAAWTITGVADATLVLDGLFLSGVDLVLAGSFDRVTLRCCTLDPGTWDVASGAWLAAIDGRALVASTLRITGDIRELVIERCILGPIVGPLVTSANGVEVLTVRDSIVQAASPGAPAMMFASGDVNLVRTTVLGPAQVHHLDGSECILHDIVTVDDTQHGCLRFSAWATGSVVPRQYECVEIEPRAGLFLSRAFGHAAYAQLLDTAGAAILAGAENGSEMGAFAREQSSVKERGLLIKYQEYLPLGLEPVVIHVT